jgi:hypothetical protein
VNTSKEKHTSNSPAPLVCLVSLRWWFDTAPQQEPQETETEAVLKGHELLQRMKDGSSWYNSELKAHQRRRKTDPITISPIIPHPHTVKPKNRESSADRPAGHRIYRRGGRSEQVAIRASASFPLPTKLGFPVSRVTYTSPSRSAFSFCSRAKPFRAAIGQYVASTPSHQVTARR